MLTELCANACRAGWAPPPRHVRDEDFVSSQENCLYRFASRCWEEAKALCTEVLLFPRLLALGVRIIPPGRLHERISGGLGQGSFGNVVVGRLHGEKVAIKTLFAQNGTSRAALLKSFLKEIEMMNGHSHSNVIGCKGVCRAGNSLHMVMEYCPKGSLYSLLRSDAYQHKPWDFKVKLALGIAKGMYFLHGQKRPIVHCDLKSPNIVLKADHTPVITDFGMASLGRARNNERQNAMWLAPEVACEGKEATTKSDVYSFAIIMWEILTGEIPWGGEHHWAVSGMLLKQRPQVSPEVLQRCGGYIGVDDYIALMQSCWQEDPEDRPNFDQVMDRLQSILSKAAGPLTYGEYIPIAQQDPVRNPHGEGLMQWNGLLIQWITLRGWE